VSASFKEAAAGAPASARSGLFDFSLSPGQQDAGISNPYKLRLMRTQTIVALKHALPSTCWSKEKSSALPLYFRRCLRREW